MIPLEQRSLVGSSLEYASEQAFSPSRSDRRARRRVVVAAPRPSDALKPGVCGKCGMEGAHARPEQCIEALRNELARLEFAYERSTPPASPATPAPTIPELPVERNDAVKAFLRRLR